MHEFYKKIKKSLIYPDFILRYKQKIKPWFFVIYQQRIFIMCLFQGCHSLRQKSQLEWPETAGVSLSKNLKINNFSQKLKNNS